MLKLIDILNEVTPPAPKPPAPKFPLPFKSGGVNLTGEAAWNKWRRWADINRKDKYIDDVLNTIKRSNYQTTQRQLDVLVKWFTGVRESLLEVKKKRDRCLRIADRKYKKPSAYKSGAAERCRAGKIWKDLKENWRDTSWENEKGQKITLLQLLDVIKNYPVKNIPIKDIEKIIIKKNTGGIESDRLDKANTQHPIIIVVDDNNNFKYVLDGNHRANKAIDSGLKSIPAKLVNIKKLSQEFQDVLTEAKKETLRTWFKRQGPKGKEGGWVDCNAPDGEGGYKACGRKKGEKRSKYPACRPTAAKCKSPGKGTKWGKTK